MDGFMLWDRETESTWWPLIGKAVSGDLVETEMNVYSEENWSQTTWGEIKEEYTEIEVLKPDQTMEPPVDWPKLNSEEIEKIRAVNTENSIAPRWGENDESGETGS